MTKPSILTQQDQQLLTSTEFETLVVGLSGGLDSVVLLHALVQLQLTHKLSALHVHHGLSPNADDWLQHCERLCAQWQVPFTAHRVTVSSKGSIETAARDARYQCFAQALGSQDVLLLAHHGDDQAETVLFRLLRGTGGRGLAGIPTQRPLGKGTLLRPLLSQTKAQLRAYAQQHQLQWVEDESNQDTTFSRNHIRHKILPVLENYAPNVTQQLQQTAQRLETDYRILDRLADKELQKGCNPWGGLDWASLSDLPEDERLFWLQHFLRKHQLTLTYEQVKNLDKNSAASKDQQPLILAGNQRIQRFQECLYVLPADTAVENIALVSGVALQRAFDDICVTGSGELELRQRPQKALLEMPSGQHRPLKKWLNDQKIPIWWREHLPYVYRNGNLVAIGTLWQHPHVKDIEVTWQLNGTLVLPAK